ncbi:unnamed protein product, partial [Allacma fusca]
MKHKRQTLTKDDGEKGSGSEGKSSKGDKSSVILGSPEDKKSCQSCDLMTPSPPSLSSSSVNVDTKPSLTPSNLKMQSNSTPKPNNSNNSNDNNNSSFFKDNNGAHALDTG